MLVCRAHLGRSTGDKAGLQAQPPAEGDSNKAVSDEEATLWA